jgi:hypothetical protein
MQSLIIDTPRPLPARRIPSHRFSDDLDVQLLNIALSDRPRPLRRSEKARRDYVPEPVVYAPPKKSLLKGLLRLVQPMLFLIVVGLGIWALNAYNAWFSTNFWYGVERTPPYTYHGSIVGAAALQGPLPERLPDGRTIMVTYRGHLPNKSLLPSISTSQPGDMWYTQDDGNCWVLAPHIAGSSELGWIDP